jgi:hypothetical protein
VSAPLRRCLLAALLAAALASQACLVLSLHPAYDDDWIAWEPDLIGAWHDADDNSRLRIEAAEWRSYRVHYEHPSEKGDLTGYLTTIGDEHYLDLTPLRGEDRGSFLLPVHMVLRLSLDGDTLSLAPLSYDVLADRLHAGRPAAPGLSAVLDQKQNVLLTLSTSRLRDWLRNTPPDAPVWGPPAIFTRQH